MTEQELAWGGSSGGAGWRMAGLVALVALVLGFFALPNGFVIDDHYLIVNNPALRSLRGIPGFFLSAWGNDGGGAARTQINAAYYRPLSSTLQAIEVAIFMGPRGLHPAGFHLVSALLHAGTTVLVTLLLLQIGKICRAGTLGGLVGGLLFAVHPVHVEAIAAISYQTTLLAGLLATAALYCATRALLRGSMGKGRLLCVALLSLLAALAKEEAAAVPLLMLLLLLLPGAGRDPGRRFPEALRLSAASFAGVAVMLLIRATVVHASGITYFSGAPRGAVMLTMARVFGLYMELLLLPLRLCPFYDWFVVPIETEPSPVVAGGLFALAVLLLAALYARRERPALSLGLLWLLAALLPVSHILPILNVAAERFLYLPSVGFCLAVAAALEWGQDRTGRRRRWLLVVGLCVIALFGARSAARLREWRDDETLNRATARDFPETPMPMYNLYNIYRAAGDWQRAVAALREAARRAPQMRKFTEELHEVEVLFPPTHPSVHRLLE